MKFIPKEIKYAIFIGWYAIIAISVYWILWFTAPFIVQIIKPNNPFYQYYVLFEESFLMADAWIVVTSLIGVIGLSRMEPIGFLFLNLAASSAVFLGLMDLNFNLNAKMIQSFNIDAIVEIFNITSCLFLAPMASYFLWKKRELFLSGKENN
jgi:hypothetical protein